ncbi:DUF2793 domain-containing protein [Dinoroseobacter sp. S375]|uniref:DUF2793 domain-containing protein n=1 Tax=Dinoroseobacter sp. S375 TaxID=3415136 RepID=UPI003C7CCF7D
MVKSANLELPLVEAAQAQKHVTVNESLIRLDAVAQLVLQSISEITPPSDASDGEVYAIPAGAEPPWNAATGQLALRSNGGWEYITPRAGWQAWIVEEQGMFRFDGTDWVALSLGSAVGPQLKTLSFDHVVTAGSSQLTSAQIPANASVIGVTGRVISEITGDLTSWRLGVSTSDNRYGSGLSTGLNGYVHGLTGQPQTYYSATPLQLTAEGGDFAGGTVRLVVHMIELGIPALV